MNNSQIIKDSILYVTFESKETKKRYTALPTNDKKIKLYSHEDETGNSDMVITETVFNNNYIKI